MSDGTPAEQMYRALLRITMIESSLFTDDRAALDHAKSMATNMIREINTRFPDLASGALGISND